DDRARASRDGPQGRAARGAHAIRLGRSRRRTREDPNRARHRHRGRGITMNFFRWLVNVPIAASSFANGVDMLHLFVISVTMLVSTYVFVAAAYFSIRHHRGKDALTLTRPLQASKKQETALIALVLGTFLLWWVIGFRQYVAMAEPPPN